VRDETLCKVLADQPQLFLIVGFFTTNYQPLQSAKNEKMIKLFSKN
jgi:hypothetical protein